MAEINRQAWNDLIEPNQRQAMERIQSILDSSSVNELKKMAKSSKIPDYYYELAMRYGKGIKGVRKNVLEGLYYMKLASELGHQPSLQQYVPLAIKYDASNYDIINIYEKGVTSGIQYGKDIDDEIILRKQQRTSIPKSWEIEMPKSQKVGIDNRTTKKLKKSSTHNFGLKFPKGSYSYDLRTLSKPEQFSELDSIPTIKEYKMFVPNEFIYKLCQEIRNGNPDYSEWSLHIDSRHHIIDGCNIEESISYGDMGAGSKTAENYMTLYINKPAIVHTESYGIDEEATDGCAKIVLLIIVAIVALVAIILGLLWYFDVLDTVFNVIVFSILALSVFLWLKDKMMDE